MQETAIDLHDVKPETAEPRQASVPCAEIIQPDLHANASQMLNIPRGLSLQKNVAAFGHFQRELLRRKPMSTEDVGDLQRKARTLELNDRHICCHKRAQPTPDHIPAGLVAQPCAHFND